MSSDGGTPLTSEVIGDSRFEPVGEQQVFVDSMTVVPIFDAPSFISSIKKKGTNRHTL